MLALILWPMLAALIFWAGLAFFFWSSWAADLAGWIRATPAEQWMAAGFLAAISGYLVTFFLVMLLIPAVYVTSLVLTALFAMPAMVEHVARSRYPDLERRKGGTALGSMANTLVAVSIYCIGWIATLPLWLFSPLAFLLPILFSAYLNQRLFRYDALAEHAGKEEFGKITERASVRLYLLGATVGLLQFVPVLNFFSPVYIGLAFIHLCLAELQQLRRETISV